MYCMPDIRFLRTLVDIGPRRIQRRLRYDLRKRLDRTAPPRLSIAWAGARGRSPQWLPVLPGLVSQCVFPQACKNPKSVSFSFLQIHQELTWPIVWNDPLWPRLWQFHLHYFDWARDWLDEALIRRHWGDQASLLEPLLDHWIEANLPGHGDGWHSYTLSLRIRNWIWLFRSCPSLATQARINSLWKQLCWLESHPEYCHGGNHWLENLICLAIGSLQFEGAHALSMHNRATRLLQHELSIQVLDDGGHEERSATYHILILDRLVELACCLSAVQGVSPSWLVSAIESMLSWVTAVRLVGGSAPRFNDSAEDSAPQIDVVINFAKSFLHGRPGSEGLRSLLLRSSIRKPTYIDPLPSPTLSRPSVVTDLPHTGWTLLRPGYGWELAFKCGVPCPPHLPPHVHSDQLSFELICNGQPLLSEAGTSIYSKGSIRSYERSGAAHNVLQLGIQLPHGGIRWIEPVDVWGAFRAARKALPRHRHSGTFSDCSCFAGGSHDGFDHIGASHVRRVMLSDARQHQIKLSTDDWVTTSRSLKFRQWWHLAPALHRDWLDALVFDSSTAELVQSHWHTTWFSAGFGLRTPRQSFCISGFLPPGRHHLRTTFPLSLASS